MLKNDVELANTEAKLAELERLIAAAKASPGAGARTEVRSLGQLANELREEVVRYRSARGTPAVGG